MGIGDHELGRGLFFMKKHCFIVKKSLYFVKNKQKVKNGTKNEIKIVLETEF